MRTSVVLIIFRRPDTTAQVFDEIRKAKPPKLFIVSDAPRAGKPEEARGCKEARAIVDNVDWDCEVFKNYSDSNMGLKKRVSTGLDWVFSHVEEAIILEDDCVPHPTFFPFCEELLERYRDDRRISSISGQNVQFGQQRTDYSYYFSRYSHCWGWATWKRAWNYYDIDMKLWPEIRRKNLLSHIVDDEQAVRHWTTLFDKTFTGEISTWDYQWTFACWMHNGLNVISDQNLISNIGFSNNSTNTFDSKSKLSEIPKTALSFPLEHPPYVIRNATADAFVQRHVYDRPWPKRLKKQIRQGIKKVLRQSK